MQGSWSLGRGPWSLVFGDWSLVFGDWSLVGGIGWRFVGKGPWWSRARALVVSKIVLWTYKGKSARLVRSRWALPRE